MKKIMLKSIQRLTLFLLTSILSASTWAQVKTIQGIVKDESGEALPGVSIVIKGTSNGTVTDFYGAFSLPEAPENAMLVFSFIGMKMQEVEVSGKTFITVTMLEDAIGLEEVVVVGYGTQKKANLTGSVAAVDFTDLETRPAANTAALLQGQMPGVTVSNFSSQPGNDNPEIRIRGIGTLNSGSNPLILVDGVESGLSQIPASDIESISVLKDAASAAIYGVRAANGVILVTTKRGKGTKSVFNFRQNVALQQALILPDLVDSWDHALIENLDRTEQGQAPLYTDQHIQLMKDGSQPDRWANTRWLDKVYRVAPINTTYFSANGSKDNIRYLVSLEYLNQQGIQIETGQKRFNFRSNIDMDVSEKIKFGLNLAGNKQDITETTTSRSMEASYSVRRFVDPTIPFKYSNGDYGQVNGLYYEGIVTSPKFNPVEEAHLGENIMEKYNFQGKLFGEIEFVKNLKFKPSFWYIYYSGLTSTFSPTHTTYDANGGVIAEYIHNSLLNDNIASKRFQTENLLTYNYSKGKHIVDLLAGQSAQLYRIDFFSAYVEDFPNNNIHELNGGINNKNISGNASELALNSYFGRVNYNFDERYLLEFNYRYDGTSRFNKDNRWGGFPSFSAGWLASNESFFNKCKF